MSKNFEALKKPIVTRVEKPFHAKYGGCSATITHVDDSSDIDGETLVTCTILHNGNVVEATMRIKTFAQSKAIALSLNESISVEEAQRKIQAQRKERFTVTKSAFPLVEALPA